MVDQAKLNLNTHEITAIGARIHAHTSSLQAAPQMVTMLIASQSSDQINEIGSKLDRIVRDLKQLESNQATTNDKLPLTFRNPDMLTLTERFISSANAVIEPGSTVWEGSEMGVPHSPEAGGSLDEAKKSHIENWIPQLTIMEEEDLQTSKSKFLTAPSETLVEKAGLEGEEIEYSDSDADDDHDFAQMCFEQAEEMFRKKEHAKAIESFPAGLACANTLSFERQNRFDLGNIRRQLALSLLHQGNLIEAEDLFQTLARGDIRDWKGAELACHAASGLAQGYMCKRSYTDADVWCKNSRTGWRRALAKEAGNKRHPLCIDALKLSAFLCELRGDSTQALIYENRAKKVGSLIDEKSEATLLKCFTLEQSLELIKNYHKAYPDLDDILKSF